MIALFSTSEDESTTDVLRWLRHLDADVPVVRVNSDQPDRVSALRVTPESMGVEIYGLPLDLAKLTAVWYRKGHSWLCNTFPAVHLPDRPALQAHLRTRLLAEESRLSAYVHTQIERGAWHLGSFAAADLNKLLTSQTAATLGFAVPEFVISTSAEVLVAGVRSFDEAITKAVSEGLYVFDHGQTSLGYFSYTETVGVDDAEAAPPAPSLVQRKIDKQFDVRVFFLEGDCHAMAIFSQSSDRTKVDFRRYNDERPNRTVPYRLPDGVEDRLRQLFSALDLNTGSADLLVDAAGDHVFLEINPVGQFGMVSQPCNYQLEREVARRLLRNESD